jgi:uncharacterized protein
MNKRVFKAAVGGVLAAAFVSMALLPGMAQTTEPGLGQTPVAGEPLRTITVIGYGEVAVAPDQALVRLGVQTEADTAGTALSQNSQQMQQLINGLTGAGIVRADIQTQNIQLYPRYSDGQNVITPTRQIVGYTASNIVEARVRNLNNLGSLLDAAVGAGSNTIESIGFVVSDAAARTDQARRAALDDAQRKASQLAAQVNGQLGEVLSIDESGSPVIPVAARLSQAAAGGAAPVEPGTQSLSAQVRVTWLLTGATGTGGTGTPEAAPGLATLTMTPGITSSPTITAVTAIATETGSETAIATEAATSQATTIAQASATPSTTDTPGPTVEVPETPLAIETPTPLATQAPTGTMASTPDFTGTIPGTQDQPLTAVLSPTITLSPTSGSAGTVVHVYALGFVPNAVVRISAWRDGSDPDVVQRWHAEPTGDISTTLTIPAFARPNERWYIGVASVDDITRRVNSEVFLVTRETP